MEKRREPAPGEVVLQYKLPDAASGTWGFEYEVRRSSDSNAPEFAYEARAPYRNVVYVGRTPEEALAALLQGFSLLSRDGSLNPEIPYERGAPPVQHAIEVLAARLRWQVDRRREHLRQTEEAVPSTLELRERMLAATQQDNEVISALATSIAALARVKDL